MKQIYLKLLAAFLMLALFSCEKEYEALEPDYRAQGLSVHEARLYFESGVRGQNTTTNQGGQQQSERIRSPKEPEWSRAYYKDLPNGQAVVVPLDLRNQVTYKLANGRYEPLTGKVFMLLFKDADNAIQVEVVSRMPDLEHLNSTEKDKEFSGTVLVEDWQGNLIKKFEICNDKVRKASPLSSSGKGQIGQYVPSGTATNEVWCETMTWYSCAYGGGEEYCNEMYSETTCWGSWDQGSIGGANPDESYYWDSEGGGGSGGDYNPQPELDFEVITDKSITENPITNCIYGKLGQGNHGYDKFLAEFQNNTKYNVTFILKAGLVDINGNPVNGFTEYRIGNTNVIIYINSSSLYRPSWEIAGTFVHEMAHAYLAQKLIDIGGPGNLEHYTTNTNFTDLFDYFSKYVNPETGQYTPEQNSITHHNLMADKLITDIAEGIRDYVETNTPEIKQEEVITLEHYKAVAWNGLRETEAYSNLSAEERSNIGKSTTILQSFTINNCQ